MAFIMLFGIHSYGFAAVEEDPFEIYFHSDGHVYISNGSDRPDTNVLWFGGSARMTQGVTQIDFQAFATFFGGLGAQEGHGWFLANPPPPVSVWFAYSVERNLWDVGSPFAHRAEPIPFPVAPTLNGGGGRSKTVIGAEIPWSQAHIAVVRPGGGIWQEVFVDGGPTDRDGVRDGQIEFSIDALQPVSAPSAVPATLEPDDLIVLLDPERFLIAVTRVDQSMIDNDRLQ